MGIRAAVGRDVSNTATHNTGRKIDGVGRAGQVGRDRNRVAHFVHVSDTLLKMLRRICVYCGSSSGNDPAYAEAAIAMGRGLAEAGIEMVYGGGRVGLMGATADACLAAGGSVIGVIPQSLWDREVGHTGLTELRVARDMHDRKATMETLADGFVALPGGFGTFEELFEQLTWLQLGTHGKPIVIFDVLGFYTPLFGLADAAVASGFLKSVHRDLLQRATSVDEAIALLRNPAVQPVPKWIDPPEGVS
jgi:uncharacterized protein (TIGR00730 family)